MFFFCLVDGDDTWFFWKWVKTILFLCFKQYGGTDKLPPPFFVRALRWQGGPCKVFVLFVTADIVILYVVYGSKPVALILLFFVFKTFSVDFPLSELVTCVIHTV